MIKEYLKTLKSAKNLSWHDISTASGLPEVTIRKIFSGETADPRFETVVKIVSAMGGSLDKVNDIQKVEAIENIDEEKSKAFSTIKEVYEERISELKLVNSERVKSLEKDKKILIIAVIVLGACLFGSLILDLFVGSIGWFRY